MWEGASVTRTPYHNLAPRFRSGIWLAVFAWDRDWMSSCDSKLWPRGRRFAHRKCVPSSCRICHTFGGVCPGVRNKQRYRFLISFRSMDRFMLCVDTFGLAAPTSSLLCIYAVALQRNEQDGWRSYEAGQHLCQS